jgi:predicted permease
MSSLLQDLRYALRTLAKAPGFTFIVVCTLSLGIGANTAIFTLMDQVLLRALPVRHPQELVVLDPNGANMGRIEGDHAFSYPMYKDLRAQAHVFDGVAARFPVAATMLHQGRSERVRAELVSGNYFQVLGLTVASGRLFSDADEQTESGHPFVVLAHGFWQRRFGANPAVVGTTIHLDGFPMTVVGVASPAFNGFTVGSPADLFVPLMMRAEMIPTDPKGALMDRRTMWLNIVARLRPGVSAEQAQTEATVIFRRTRQEELKQIPARSGSFNKRFLETRVDALPGYRGLSEMRDQFSTPVIVLMTMVGLVLLIACANVANLLVARAPGRQREIAIRLALGASRARIVQQLLIESLALALLGGGAGVLVSIWAADLLLKALPFEGAARTFVSTPDARVLLFALGVSVLTGVLFGLLPAWQTARPRLVPALKEEGGAVVSSGHVWLRKGLVVAQVALSLLLLVGAGLFARSLWNLRSLDPGFRVDRMMTFALDPSLNGYPTEQASQVFARLRDQLARQPGVLSVSLAANRPLSGDVWMATVNVDGYQAKDAENLNPHMNTVGPDYFRTMGMALVAGREFTEGDGATAPKVAVINEAMARYFYRGQNPIGRRFGIGRGTATDIEIVGVVKDGKEADLRKEPARSFYIPYMQDSGVGQMTFFVRTRSDAVLTADGLRRIVRQVDAAIPVFQLKSMEAVADESLFVDRMVALLSASFGALATLLAAVGLYGVMSYAVARRTREIGLRMALGADAASVVWMVMREVVMMAAIGVAVGLPLAVASGRLISSLLFGVSAADPGTLVGATGLLLTVALLAGYVPAGQATRVDPMRALRWE